MVIGPSSRRSGSVMVWHHRRAPIEMWKSALAGDRGGFSETAASRVGRASCANPTPTSATRGTIPKSQAAVLGYPRQHHGAGHAGHSRQLLQKAPPAVTAIAAINPPAEGPLSHQGWCRGGESPRIRRIRVRTRHFLRVLARATPRADQRSWQVQHLATRWRSILISILVAQSTDWSGSIYWSHGLRRHSRLVL
jgi:hypothetical protein